MNQQLKLVRTCVKIPNISGTAHVFNFPQEYYVDANGKKQALYIENDIHHRPTKIGMCKDDKFDGLVTEIYGEDHYATFSYVMGTRQGPFSEVKSHRVIKQGVYENDKLKEARTYTYKTIKGNEVCIVSPAKGVNPQIRQPRGR